VANESGGDAVSSMATTEAVVEGLNDLLQLDHDAVGAYEIAIEHLEDRDHALQIEGFKADHERHIRELNDLIQALGGVPRNEPHQTSPLKQAIQRIAAGRGDRALLTAWRANELQVTAKYDGYASRAVSWPAEAKALVDRNALDEERHYAWVVRVLGGEDAAEIHLVNRARENATVARVAGARAGERLARAATKARRRAADHLHTAADRLDGLARPDGEVEGLRARAVVGAQHVARRLDSGATYLRDGGMDDPRSALEEEIRANPARSLAAAFAIGFVLGRVIR
jgi:rubrerythrin